MRNSRQNNMPEPCKSCGEIKKKLQTVDFALIDTALYLNAYPDCAEALEYYHKLLAEHKKLTEEVNEKCGPLTAMSNESHTEWNWVSEPWPWQIEAN